MEVMTSPTTATPIQPALSADTFPRIERTPRPYHAGACLVLCADPTLDRPCNSLAAAHRYIAFLQQVGKVS